MGQTLLLPQSKWMRKTEAQLGDMLTKRIDLGRGQAAN